MPQLLTLTVGKLHRCSKHELARWHERIGAELRHRYPKSYRRLKRGNVAKGFTDPELEHFLSHVRNAKALLAFQLMAYLGLRIGEAAPLHTSQIYLGKSSIYIETEKAHTGDRLFLHPAAKTLIMRRMRTHRDEIARSGGYLLPAQWGEGHVSPEWLRNEFRATLERADMDETYAMSDETSRTPRKLHRLSSHSLRHYFITKVYNVTRDLRLAQRLARHQSINTTQIYIGKTQQEMDDCVRDAFAVRMTEPVQFDIPDLPEEYFAEDLELDF